ncbi:uncharacterized protein LOC118202904 [Stegodyphus dumicola]|uniref:uncharacterized protein LOC118202904 n=1 Tax=Stegodyphus dumicola TaxID=202533 RepID=UPI0015ACAD45|nr:uncharacterized protein LOC118202904 [Stegodyphus dumicola]
MHTPSANISGSSAALNVNSLATYKSCVIANTSTARTVQVHTTCETATHENQHASIVGMQIISTECSTIPGTQLTTMPVLSIREQQNESEMPRNINTDNNGNAQTQDTSVGHFPTRADPMTDFNIRHIDQSALKIVQINLQRARAATAQVIQYAMETETDFIIAQEPYLYDNRVSEFPLSLTVFQATLHTAEGTRTAIICCQQKWSPTITLASRDFTTRARVYKGGSTLQDPGCSLSNDSHEEFTENSHLAYQLFTTATDDPPFQDPEVNAIMRILPKRKAPGPDSLDYSIVKAVHKEKPGFLCKYFNKLLEHRYFPVAFKTGQVVLFAKPEKHPNDPASFRPICLLSAIGKVLEKLAVTRLKHHLTRKKFLSQLQFGFRESISTVHALDLLQKEITEARSNNQHVAVLSLDLQSAFDSLWWPAALEVLHTADIPNNLLQFFKSYLSNRQFIVVHDRGIITRQQTRGSPQG